MDNKKETQKKLKRVNKHLEVAADQVMESAQEIMSTFADYF